MKKWNILTLLLIALLTRLVVIDQSLWLDEAIGAIAVKNYSYSGILSDFIRNDNHTPLYYLTLKLWSDLFGYSELALRSLSVIFGLGTVFLTYIISLRLSESRSKLSPIMATLFVATSQFHIYYSQEARMYSMAAFFAALAIYSYISTFINKSIIYWISFSFSIAAMVFTDYVPVFLLPVFIIYAINNVRDRKWWIKFVLSFIPLAVLTILWLPIFLKQSENGRWLLQTLPGWKRVAGGATFKQVALLWMKFVFGRITFPNKIYYYILVGLASLPFALSYIKLLFTKKTKYVNLIVLWLILPLVIGYLISYIIPAFIYFRFLYVIPAFYILVAWSIDTFTVLPLKKFLLILILGLNLFGWLTYVADEKQQREQWRGAVDFVETKGTEKSIAVFEFPQPFAPYLWYDSGVVEAEGVTDSISANKGETERKTRESITGKSDIFYFEYLHDLVDPEGVVLTTIKTEEFELREVYDFYGVGNVFYFKKT